MYILTTVLAIGFPNIYTVSLYPPTGLRNTVASTVDCDRQLMVKQYFFKDSCILQYYVTKMNINHIHSTPVISRSVTELDLLLQSCFFAFKNCYIKMYVSGYFVIYTSNILLYTFWAVCLNHELRFFFCKYITIQRHIEE